MPGEGLGISETLRLHELLAFKSGCAIKATVMQQWAADPKLRELCSAVIEMDKAHIEDLRDLIAGNIE